MLMLLCSACCRVGTWVPPDTDCLHMDLCLVCSLPPRVQRKTPCCWSSAWGLEPSCPLSWPPVSEASNQVAHLTVSGTCPNLSKPVPDTFPHSCFSLIMPQDLVTFECGLLSQSFSLTLESPVQCSYLGFSALCWFPSSRPTKSSSESTLSSVTAFLSLAKLHFEK